MIVGCQRSRCQNAWKEAGNRWGEYQQAQQASGVAFGDYLKISQAAETSRFVLEKIPQDLVASSPGLGTVRAAWEAVEAIPPNTEDPLYNAAMDASRSARNACSGIE